MILLQIRIRINVYYDIRHAELKSIICSNMRSKINIIDCLRKTLNN